MLLRLLSSSVLVALTSASFCGDSAVPFSLEILPTGQPVLGCARPTCFGWAPNGHPASNTGAFYRVNDHGDGFMRAGPESIPSFGPNDARYYRPYAAMCDLTFSSYSCAGLNQWVGGIAPQANITAYPTTLQCCTFDGLLQSEDRGVAPLLGGQAVIGGEVISSGIQVGFDYISDVAKVVRADGTVQYDVSVRRMPCTDPTAANAKITKPAGAQAFQAPNLLVEEPLPLPPAGPTGPAGPAAPTNLILEEIVQEEAIQLAPGTQFEPVQPPPPPPPQFQPVAFQPQFVQPPPYAPVAAPYYPPVAYGGGGPQWCFTGDMTVQTVDGTTKRMDELKKQDWVLSASNERLEYVPVEFWLHRVPEQEAEFNEFETEDAKTIKLTDKHYIFKGDCTRVSAGPLTADELPFAAVTADQVHAGDCLFVAENNLEMREVRVVRHEKVIQTGIYAPMTTNGRIIVNGIHASCHNIMQAHSVGGTVGAYFNAVNKIYDAIFGYDANEIIETPAGLSTILAMADFIMPKNM